MTVGMQMKSISERRATLREVDISNYPELRGYTKNEIWHGIGPGGLYLVSRLARAMDLQPGAWVLDLGCGGAQSSIYLAKHYGVNVIAADLWRDPSANARKIESQFVAIRSSRSVVPPWSVRYTPPSW